MESSNKLKEVSIQKGTCYYFDNIIKIEDFDIDNIFIDEKSCKNIFVYKISYQTLMGVKHLRIKFDKINGFVKVHDGTRYLVLFGGEKYDFIYNRIRYLIGVKSRITYAISHCYAKIKVDSYDSLPLEKTLIFHNMH